MNDEDTRYPRGDTNGSGGSMSTEPHERYVELCAILTSGEITEEERRVLDAHLAHCPECRQSLREFEAVIAFGVPLLQTELQNHESSSREVGPSKAASRSAGFASHTIWKPQEISVGRDRLGSEGPERGAHFQTSWNYAWISLASAAVLIVALTVYTYQIGKDREHKALQSAANTEYAQVETLEKQFSDVAHERQRLAAQLTNRDSTILRLRKQIEIQNAALEKIRVQQANLANSLQGQEANNQEMANQRASLSQQLSIAQASLREVQREFKEVASDRDERLTRLDALEGRTKDLSAQVTKQDLTITQDEELLAHDRDIRELMGARDLYIADVYDVKRDGSTNKPFGRIFYTKGKSLVFYAYDLDQQPGVKETSAFQAWGQDGPDRQHALSLGVFYRDNVANKRWVLKFDDPRELEQINAVFVTVEPEGGSPRPSGKSLLYASLRVGPNHP